MRTYSQKPAEVTRKWYVIDASTASVGRVSTVAASLLIGKGKPTFTPHVDGGDYVIITNATNMVVTGNKETGKLYQNHSGYPGGLRTRTLSEVKPAEILTKAIRNMLPANKLREGRLERLKIYDGANHNHAAQKPEEYKLQKEAK